MSLPPRVSRPRGGASAAAAAAGPATAVGPTGPEAVPAASGRSVPVLRTPARGMPTRFLSASRSGTGGRQTAPVLSAHVIPG